MLRIDKWAFSCGPPPTLQLSSHLMYLHCILSFYLQQTQKYEHKSRPQQESRADRSLSSCAEYEKTWWMRPFGTTYLSLFTKESKTKKIHYAKERKIKKRGTHWHSPPPADSSQRIFAPRGGHAARARALTLPRHSTATYKSPPNVFPSRYMELPLPLPSTTFAPHVNRL